jgi:hypothetical protein
MTDQELRDLVANLAISQTRTDEQIKELKNTQEKNELQWQRTMETLSNVGHNNGAHTEDYFYNALKDTMVFGGIKYDYIEKNIKQRKQRLQDEFDIILYNGTSVAIIECKYKAHKTDVEQLVDKKITNFKILNPDYANYNIYCGIGSFSFYDELEEAAAELGVGILKQQGDVTHIYAENLKAY